MSEVSPRYSISTMCPLSLQGRGGSAISAFAPFLSLQYQNIAKNQSFFSIFSLIDIKLSYKCQMLSLSSIVEFV